ncbi:nucleotide sugar dehydrogenase [Aquirhabdus parva]|uniref:Nucleotide sugar dehydrogenase n=1 Tax=Aquirhabdus parva TaxID=2283318 RepID=A0A345P7D5_9GAMM|nr:nucleotide sugar dehydrogenase [Aquirhabdus parva]AXI03194.1 nucleotide sugar dehydrogenase [Aquirhabdus parva]
MTIQKKTVAIVGLGYVGLPLALAFGRQLRTIGFDINADKISAYQQKIDPTGEMDAEHFVASTQITFTHDAADLAAADFIITAVPTPINNAKLPDLSPVESASRLIATHMKDGATVIFESTVYPGVTEEICKPILAASNKNFRLGYSPERINPGDKARPLESIMKIVSGQDAATLADVSALYRLIITAGVHEAPSIKVAEAAKILENTQRDVNIALMNEFALICQRAGIDTQEVLEAAGTKWNFLKFFPGLVGGHCIGVDPYYLTFRAEQLGYHADLMMAARHINDSMGIHIAQNCIKMLCQNGTPVGKATVLVLGLTFKENCSDTRNTRVIDIIQELQSYGVTVHVVDPVADAAEVKHEYQLDLIDFDQINHVDAVIAAVSHDQFKSLSIEQLKQKTVGHTPFLDVKGSFNRAQLEQAGFKVWRL